MRSMNDYETPSDEIFNAIKVAAIDIWKTYDDTHGYATEKIDRVNAITNYMDNWGTMVGMFDSNNQTKLILALSKTCPIAIPLVLKWMGVA